MFTAIVDNDHQLVMLAFRCRFTNTRELKKKTGHPTRAHNFAKCWSMFKILSPLDSAVNV